MAKAILEFDLTKSNDRYAFAVATKSHNLVTAIKKVAKHLRESVDCAENTPYARGLEQALEMLQKALIDCDLRNLIV